MGRWAGAACGWVVGGVLPRIQGWHRGGGTRGVGDWVMVEGQQTGHLGDRMGVRLGRLGGGAGGHRPSGGPSRVAGASGVATGMGEGWVVVFSKPEEQPRAFNKVDRAGCRRHAP